MGANNTKYSKTYYCASRIKLNLSIILFSILVLGFYFLKTFGITAASFVSSLMFGSAVGCFISILENHSIQFKPVRRRCSFCNHIAIKTTNFSIVLAIFLSLTVLCMSGIDQLLSLGLFPSGIGHFFKFRFWEILTISMGLAFCTNIFLEINRKLGPGLFLKLVLGKYHQPQEEERIFLFIDLNNSTQMAEKLGNLRFSQLLQDFFFDISEAVSQFGGEIYQYVGDEVVISWDLSKGVENNNSVEFYLEITRTIKHLSHYYNLNYGLTPTFKGGIHGGKVVMAEIGKIKTEIAYHGDVLNTTSRITDLCKALNKDFLISESLINYLSVKDDYSFTRLGSFNLRGKSTALELYTLTTSNIKNDVDSISFQLSLN